MISIIIPTYNRLAKLQRCIRSIVSQHIAGIEIIVVDDCSSDGTSNWLETTDYRHLFKWISYQHNKGVNYARNRGVDLATQPFTMFIDSDDMMLPGSLGEIINVIENNKTFRHYLFLLSCRSAEFKDMKETRQVTYADWMSARVSGDFTHVIATSIIKAHPFFEEFRMYEQLNWFRVYKATSPQVILPIVTSEIEVVGKDRLTAAHKLNNAEVIKKKFLSEKKFYDLYHTDLKRYNQKYLSGKLIENTVLGIASNCKKESKEMLLYAEKEYVKWLGKFIHILPPLLLRVMIIRFSNIKSRISISMV